MHLLKLLLYFCRSFPFDGWQVSVAGGGLGSQDDGDNQAVQTESFAENKYEDHTDVDILLGVSTDTSITSDTEGQAGSEGGQAAAET